MHMPLMFSRLHFEYVISSVNVLNLQLLQIWKHTTRLMPYIFVIKKTVIFLNGGFYFALIIPDFCATSLIL